MEIKLNNAAENLLKERLTTCEELGWYVADKTPEHITIAYDLGKDIVICIECRYRDFIDDIELTLENFDEINFVNKTQDLLDHDFTTIEKYYKKALQVMHHLLVKLEERNAFDYNPIAICNESTRFFCTFTDKLKYYGWDYGCKEDGTMTLATQLTDKYTYYIEIQTDDIEYGIDLECEFFDFEAVLDDIFESCYDRDDHYDLGKLTGNETDTVFDITFPPILRQKTSQGVSIASIFFLV